MAAIHQTELLSVSDCKIYELLTDPSGGTATYGTAIDLPDITSATLEGDTDVKERRGDGTVRSQISVLTGLTLTLENTLLDLNVLALLEGGAVVDSGTGTSEVATYTYSKSSENKYVKVELKCDLVSAGLDDVHLVVYKAKLTNKIALGLTDDDFQTYSYELGAVARSADDAYYAIKLNESATPLSA